MEILLVSYFSKEITYGKGRMGYLMKYLPEDTHFTLLATDFNHREKRYYEERQKPLVSENGVENHYIHIKSYKKNLSFKRIWSNIEFGRGVKKFLKNTSTDFDLIYCIVPSASGVLGCRNYIKIHKTKLVVDVMDLLPESLLPIIGDNVLTSLILRPWFRISGKAYKTAHFITGESKEYANIAHQCNPQVPYTYTYLGVDMNKINAIIDNSSVRLNDEGCIRICYGGNLGNSYDFESITDALVLLREKGINYTMYFVGGGDKEEYVRTLIQEKNLNAVITGIVPYETYIAYMSQCDIGLNVFKKGTQIVHSYKFNDYAACGLYIVSNLYGETEEMISQYDCGITTDDISQALLVICTSWDTYKMKKQNSQKMANEVLNADVIYKKQAERILELLN